MTALSNGVQRSQLITIHFCLLAGSPELPYKKSKYYSKQTIWSDFEMTWKGWVAWQKPVFKSSLPSPGLSVPSRSDSLPVKYHWVIYLCHVEQKHHSAESCNNQEAQNHEISLNVCDSELLHLEVKSLSCVGLFATPWTIAYQAPPSMEFSRQEY